VRALIDTCTNRRKGSVSDTAACPLSHLAYSRKKRGKEEKTRYRYDVPKKTFEQMSYM